MNKRKDKMKKKYMEPSVEVIELETRWRLMAGSDYQLEMTSEDADEHYEVL